MFCCQRHDPEDAFQNRAINNYAVRSEEIWNAEQKKNGMEWNGQQKKEEAKGTFVMPCKLHHCISGIVHGLSCSQSVVINHSTEMEQGQKEEKKNPTSTRG